MAQTGHHENPNTSLWPKCVVTGTKLENSMVNPHEDKCAYEKVYRKMKDYARIIKYCWENEGCMQCCQHKYTLKDQVMTCTFY